MEKTDISSRKDIKFIIATFYEKLLADVKMYPFFKDIVHQNHLEEHLEIITDFWEDILFQSYKYKNNPMQKHLDFAKKMPFSKEHFLIWLDYLQSTIDDFFEGTIAHLMKTRAQSIAMVMQVKMKLYV